MSVPLTATARIKLQYAVNSLEHVHHAYCAYNLVLGVPQLVDRDGITTILWTLAAQYLWDKARTLWGVGAVPGAALATLEDRSGALWQVREQAQLTGVGSVLTALPASQLTIVLRDTSFKKLRIVWLEQGWAYVSHQTVTHQTGASIAGLEDAYNGVDANASAPFRWQKSRGDRFLHPLAAFVGTTLDTNDKLRRARHLV